MTEIVKIAEKVFEMARQKAHDQLKSSAQVFGLDEQSAITFEPICTLKEGKSDQNVENLLKKALFGANYNDLINYD